MDTLNYKPALVIPRWRSRPDEPEQERSLGQKNTTVSPRFHLFYVYENYLENIKKHTTSVFRALPVFQWSTACPIENPSIGHGEDI